jgi:hypothetical protein
VALAAGAASQGRLDRRALDRAGLVWAPEVRGTLCHRLIAELCERGIIDPHGIEPRARAVLPRGLARVHEQALLSFLVPMAGSYLARSARAGWQFEGSEVIVGGVALDLLWKRGGRLQADEVKSCASVAITWRERAAAQARTQACAARSHYGPAFEGVRVVALAVPDDGFWVSA